MGTRPLMVVHAHPGFRLWAPWPLICVYAHLEFQMWAPSLLIWVGTNRASGVCWGCLSGVHSLGAEGVGAQEATGCCREFSKQLPSASIIFFFSKNSSYSTPPSPTGPDKHLAPCTAQSSSLPRILHQTLCPGRGDSAALVPVLVPGTLLSLSTFLTV